ncbi:DUF4396 domain-containing protein [Actinomyces minihominis]|uniref:DUF4396 domain-containing protein n=1 Tax=Actinomyces minihominis TaxID=2002838 RepID=UPI000C0809AC|nr:DUF4396 domain-containing protein [Actinomyces minihominis]
MQLHSVDLPTWLVVLSTISLILGVLSAAFIAIDVRRRPQLMRVMDFVWPIDGLWGSVGWVAAYLWWGRAGLRGEGGHPPQGQPMKTMKMSMGDQPTAPMKSSNMPAMSMKPALGMRGKPHAMPVSVFIGTSHCGAGCSMADLVVEWLIFFVPSVAVVGGLSWFFTDPLFAGWVISYFVALLFGITFQYAAISPMNPQRGIWGNIKTAAKADVLSLSAWQIGMYGAMAIGQLWIFPTFLGGQVATNTPVFWFMMQIAMLAGFCTAYPVNWLLIKFGIKERM